MQGDAPIGWMSYAVPIALAAVVLGLRLRAIRRPRRLRLETLWIVPALYLCVTVAMFWSAPPGALGWIAAMAALALGGVLGWQRGRMMTISVDPKTHALSQRGSPLAVFFLFVLIVLRGGLRASVGNASAGWHLNAAVVTEALVALALGMFAATRLEMLLRARRLLDAARAHQGEAA